MLRLLGSLLLAAAWLPLVTAAAPRAPAETPAARASSSAATVSAPRSVTTPHSIELTPEAASILFAMAHRTADASNAAALFAPKSWYTPPPPPAAAPAPVAAAPTAPPLPFAFLGRYTDSNDVTVYFVTRDDRVYDVKPGDAIDSIYTVEAADKGQLVFLYKPLNTRQSLAMGDSP